MPDNSHPAMPESARADYRHSDKIIEPMGAVWHESRARRRYLLSARDEGTLAAWCADQYAGAV